MVFILLYILGNLYFTLLLCGPVLTDYRVLFCSVVTALWQSVPSPAEHTVLKQYFHRSSYCDACGDTSVRPGHKGGLQVVTLVLKI